MPVKRTATPCERGRQHQEDGREKKCCVYFRSYFCNGNYCVIEVLET